MLDGRWNEALPPREDLLLKRRRVEVSRKWGCEIGGMQRGSSDDDWGAKWVGWRGDFSVRGDQSKLCQAGDSMVHCCRNR
jgi:hypothetical protein